jgi:uncharacterized protein (DUF58 family)
MMQGFLNQLDPLNHRQFVLAVKKLANTLSYGTDKSPFRGTGIEFVQSRPYLPGDPIRAIDWRVTARSGKLYVKEFESPKRMPCYLLVDTSASMTIASGKRSKYAVAVHIAGGIALAALERVSPVGVVGVGGRDFRMEPSLSNGQILQWLHKLRRFRFDERTNLGRRILELAPSLTSRCLVIILSDMHDDTAFPALKLLSQRHDVVVLRLEDPAERGLAGAGFLRASEAETGKEFTTHSRRRWVDPEATTAALKLAGIDQLVIHLDQPFTARLRHFFKSRNLLGRGAR